MTAPCPFRVRRGSSSRRLHARHKKHGWQWEHSLPRICIASIPYPGSAIRGGRDDLRLVCGELCGHYSVASAVLRTRQGTKQSSVTIQKKPAENILEHSEALCPENVRTHFLALQEQTAPMEQQGAQGHSEDKAHGCMNIDYCSPAVFLEAWRFHSFADRSHDPVSSVRPSRDKIALHDFVLNSRQLNNYCASSFNGNPMLLPACR